MWTPVAVAAAVVVGCSSPPRHVTDARDPLEVRIRLDQPGTELDGPRYHADDAVGLEVELINRGSVPLVLIAPLLRLTGPNNWATLNPLVASGPGTPMLGPDPRVTSTNYMEIKIPDVPETITLAPGAAWTGTVPLHSSDTAWMYGELSTTYPGNWAPGSHGEPTLLPGHYTVALEYTTRWTDAPDQSHDWQVAAARAWHGTAVSNRLALAIEP